MLWLQGKTGSQSCALWSMMLLLTATSIADRLSSGLELPNKSDTYNTAPDLPTRSAADLCRKGIGVRYARDINQLRPMTHARMAYPAASIFSQP